MLSCPLRPCLKLRTERVSVHCETCARESDIISWTHCCWQYYNITTSFKYTVCTEKCKKVPGMKSSSPRQSSRLSYSSIFVPSSSWPLHRTVTNWPLVGRVFAWPDFSIYNDDMHLNSSASTEHVPADHSTASHVFSMITTTWIFQRD